MVFITFYYPKSEFDKSFYFNFEEEPGLKGLFEQSLSPSKILQRLSIAGGAAIRPDRDLIIFDEIQECNNALNSLKYFCEKAPEFHITAAGSLLGVKLSRPRSFPVGKVNILELYPLTFFEFLRAVGEEKYISELTDAKEILPLPELFHDELIDLMKIYYFVGGMPEAVHEYTESGDVALVRDIHREILKTVELDFAKHPPTAEIPKISLLWNSIPEHLSRENKKFIFSAVKKSARAREYENALQWLVDAGLVLKAYNATRGELPLKAYANKNIFKIYMLDTGLLGAMSGLQPESVIKKSELFKTFKGALVENYIAQQLSVENEAGLFYWKREGAKAEVDFLYELNREVLPLEVKSGVNFRSKSLRSYDDQYNPPLMIRSTLLNLKKDGKVLNIPLYAINTIKGLVSRAAPAAQRREH